VIFAKSKIESQMEYGIVSLVAILMYVYNVVERSRSKIQKNSKLMKKSSRRKRKSNKR
jgi:hypothetical protein